MCSLLTFVKPNDLVAPLNINDSFDDMTIIKQNNMAYQHKVTFYIWDEFGVDTYIPVTRVLKSEKTQTHTQTQSKRKNPIKLGLVWAGNRGYDFCCHAYLQQSRVYT